ncbi:hypothetical protein LINPERHAP1_LOCUS7234 [Linum perenne]
MEIHCDGSFLHDSQKAAYGIILSNSHGQIFDGRAETIFCSSPMVSEAHAILQASRLAMTLPTQVTIYSDCLCMINAVHAPKHQWPWECYGLLGNISAIKIVHPNIKFKFISRNRNKRANWLARKARLGTIPRDWMNIVT